MRVLLLSDIHANLQALEACLEVAPGHDIAVNLGDVVGYGGNPNEVVERVRQYCDAHVRGNHDRACSGLSDLSSFNPLAALSAFWTRRALTPESIEWLRTLPRGPVTVAGLDHVQFVHGSPSDEDEYLLAVTDGLTKLLISTVPLSFFGHTHIQGGFSLYGDAGSEIHPFLEAGNGLARNELQLLNTAKYLINPGSVGQPRDGDWRAACALYDSHTSKVTFYRVPYDLKRAQKRILEAALPSRLAARLEFGR